MKAVPEAEAAALEPGSRDSHHEFSQLTQLSRGDHVALADSERKKHVNLFLSFL